MLITVSGVGPRLAQSVLSGISVEQFRACMAQGDLIPLTAIPGVGKKTAQRLLVDLREKFSKEELAEGGLSVLGEEAASPVETDAIKALVSLGCRTKEAERLVRMVRRKHPGELTLEDIILKALQHS
jgi:Holliday junction DNA helicase RuvA